MSNGPILEFEADGSESGDTIDFNGAKEINARVVARSILPFTTLEIVLNGETIGHKTVPIYSNAPVDGVYSMELAATTKFTRSSWMAARLVDHPDLRNPILPRRVSVFAHTSPIYFIHGGQKVRDEASVEYLRNTSKVTLHWLGTNPAFVNQADRQNAEREAREALRIYRAL